MKAPPEKMGSFFLGSEYDLEDGEITGEFVNYDARDLTTHAVCIGMTGSGKTGLCICLLEEAALDKVPAIIIDPKGDITNHLLHFPELQPSDFEEWINIDDARRKNLSKEEYASQIADTWEKGLESWGIGKQRIINLSKSVDYTIYTPGSSSGIPINILSSLEAPLSTDRDTLNNLVSGTTSALLRLINNNQDSLRSKEGVIISSILHHNWSQKQSLSLETLINQIQTPPFNRLGVFDLDTYFPSGERFELALQFNSLIASPSFNEWMSGDSLNISKLLFLEDGKPRHNIFSLAHLSEEERMFFVTLLLERISNWMQSQSGTTSLRAIVYFDEVFGYMPPVANPPSKTPLLRLLKQGRSFGLGVVLTTQNPVDLDYKGLTNTGTWFIGKLQTERDKNRVLEGLRGAEQQLANQDTVDYGEIIGKLRSRVFLLHNVHDDATKIFHTRWAMNYLRGPLTGIQIKVLMKEKRDRATIKTRVSPGEFSTSPPHIDPNIEQYYVELKNEKPIGSDTRDGKILFNSSLLINYKLRFYDKKRGIDKSTSRWVVTPEPDKLDQIDWSRNQAIDPNAIYSKPLYSDNSIAYNQIPSIFNTVKELKKLQKEFSKYLYRNEKFVIGTHPDLEIYQGQDDTRADFIVKVRQTAREKRDTEIDKLERKYDTKLDRINSRINRLTDSLNAKEAEHDARKREEIFGVGETVLGVFLGRRRTTGITTASRRRRMTTQTKHKIEETKKEIEDLKKELEEVESELKEQVKAITSKWEDVQNEIVDYEITPKRTDVYVDEPKIAWVYYR
jgi:hypothetical protein